MQSDLCKGMLSQIYQCYKYEGVVGFYKGMGFPLATVPLLNAIVFSTNELCKIYFGFHDENSLVQGTITGSIAGLANSVIITPMELVKCRLQVQRESKLQAKYKGIFDCLKQIYLDKGIKGVYQGNVITVFREVAAYGTQFGFYYFAKNILSQLTNKKIKDLDNFSLMFAGALSGVICWMCSFPQDVVKTKIQLDLVGDKYKKRGYDGGMIDCCIKLYRKEGNLNV